MTDAKGRADKLRGAIQKGREDELESLVDSVRANIRRRLDKGVVADAEGSVHQEERDLERDRKRALLRQLKTQNVRWRHDMRLRSKYASLAFGLASWAIWFWIVMFVAVGIGNAASGRPILSDAALITLTTGATVNVVAVFVVVIRGLFPASQVSEGTPRTHK